MSVWERNIMSYEFNSYINERVARVFVDNLLMDEKNMTTIIHNHKYAEFHIVYGGKAKIFINDNEYVFSSGSVYSIPAGTYHCYIKAEPQTQIIAFQTDIALNAFDRHSISETVIKEIINILKKEKFHSECSDISSLISFAVSGFFQPAEIKKSSDYAIVIYEFISKNYNQNINISELAKKLYLSDKQTERLVKKHMGLTFKKAMVNYRMKIASFLEKNTDMSKAEISRYVGYSDYSGYWKAKKQIGRISNKK